jgi:GntR family transcriptional regulator
MVQFRVQADSEIPASTQLFNQISFAIAARQFPPGYRLPSTRQLAMQTGLHRNTISKVYERLELAGLVEALVGSGIYVRALGQESVAPKKNSQPPVPVYKVIQQSLDAVLGMGYSLNQARELFQAEVDARLQAGLRLVVTVPQHDRGAGELIVQELKQSLSVPVQLYFLEDLAMTLEPMSSATIVTVRYFASQAEVIAKERGIRFFPIDIYDYTHELEVIKQLSPGSCLGLVSLSSGTLGVAEVMIHSLRGEEIFVMTAQADDQYKLRALVRSAQTIISDQASCAKVKAAVQKAGQELIRLPKVICSESYIDLRSIQLLKRELGLG